jgi:hypothetical protein
LFPEEDYALKQQIAPASRGVSRGEALEVMGLLHEMIDRLVVDLGFSRSQSPRQVAARHRRRVAPAMA